MRQNRIVVVAVILLLLCLCAVVICAGAYLILGQSLDILGQAAASTWTALPPPPPAGMGAGEGSVVVTTDRPWYASRDPVRISVTNQLNVPIWYAEQVDCGLSFWWLKDCDSEAVIQHALPCIWAEPDHRFTQLPPGESIEDVWSGMIEVRGESGVVELPVEPGCYEVSVPYSLSEPDAHLWRQGEFADATSPGFMQR